MRIELDDTGFPQARVQRGSGDVRAVGDGHSEAIDGETLDVRFPGVADGSVAAVRVRLQLRTDPAIGLVVRASRRHEAPTTVGGSPATQ